MIYPWLKKLTHWLLPPACLLCMQKKTHAQAQLCHDCHAGLPWQSAACRVCAYPLNVGAVCEPPERNSQHPYVSVDNRVCGQCLMEPPPFDSTHSALQYRAPVDHWVLALKFRQQLAYATLLAQLFLQTLPYQSDIDKPERIIPMPLHTQRLRERGYNQALEIARLLARKLHIPLSVSDCQRIVATAPQAAMSAGERRKNVQQAFWVSPDLTAKHVVIVDDVVTTGSTVAELSRALRRAGVERIDVWCCARTIMNI